MCARLRGGRPRHRGDGARPEAVALLAGNEVPPVIAQATVLHQMLVTDATTDLDAIEAVLTQPVETLGGEVVGYLAAVAR